MLKKLILFGLIGIVNTAADWLGFWFLSLLLPPATGAVWAAKSASYGLGILCSYGLNSNITFRREYLSKKREGNRDFQIFSRFLIAALLCLVLNSAVYVLLRDKAFMDLTALIIATLAAFLVGFFLNLNWTYGDNG